MPPNSRKPAWLMALVAMALLFAQVSGLHHHRHVELSEQAAHSHGSQLHFEDAGLHVNEADASHSHVGGQNDALHPHLDIDTRVVDDGATKLNLDLLTLFLVALVIVFCLPLLGRKLPRAVLTRPPRRTLCYALRPPSQAPPLNLVL